MGMGLRYACVPDLLVMFFADRRSLDAFIQSSKGNNWSEAFEEIRWQETADLDGVEPFGFVDGISQPQIDWDRQRDVTRPPD